MTKIQRQIFLSLIFCILAWNTTAASSAAEALIFKEVDETFWVIKSREAFTEGAKTLIDNEGNWKGKPPIPQYIKFAEQLTQDDLPTLEKWLSLKGLTCFAIADFSAQPNLRLIDSWYLDLTEQEENVDKKDEKLKMNNFYKLAWLDFKTSLNEVERGEQSLLLPGCVEKNRLFQLKNSHYANEIMTH